MTIALHTLGFLITLGTHASSIIPTLRALPPYCVIALSIPPCPAHRKLYVYVWCRENPGNLLYDTRSRIHTGYRTSFTDFGTFHPSDADASWSGKNFRRRAYKESSAVFLILFRTLIIVLRLCLDIGTCLTN